MPSNQTPNYQLSQWEKSDKVLMEDFNNDNAKIDAALEGLAARTGLVLLNEITLTEASNHVQVPLQLDWSEWKIIHIDVIPAAGTSSKMYFCGSFSPVDKVAPLPTTRCHIMLLPMGWGDTLFTALIWGTSQVYSQQNYPFRSIGYGISFNGEYAEYSMAAGSKIIIQGERV